MSNKPLCKRCGLPSKLHSVGFCLPGVGKPDEKVSEPKHETFSASDVRHYVREFKALHGKAVEYLSRDVVECLVDSWILRHLVLRGPRNIGGLSAEEAREIHRKMYTVLWPE